MKLPALTGGRETCGSEILLALDRLVIFGRVRLLVSQRALAAPYIVRDPREEACRHIDRALSSDLLFQTGIRGPGLIVTDQIASIGGKPNERVELQPYHLGLSTLYCRGVGLAAQPSRT